MASFLKHFRTVSGLTVLSRVAGLVRDAALAHVLGAGWIMDAYSMAFRMPNLLRQLLGEGALTAAFVPVFTEYLEKNGRRAAGRFMSLMAVVLVAALAALALAVIGALLVLRHLSDPGTKWHLIFGLGAVLFPFALFVCLVALFQAALNCCRHFAMPAIAPIVLNLFIIAGALAAGLWVTGDPVAQAYVIAGAILVAGVAEIAIQLPILKHVGLVLRPVWAPRDAGLRRVLLLLGPVVVAVGVIQINVFMDSLLANLLSPNVAADAAADAPVPEAFDLGPWRVPYPMKTGAASVLYYGPLIYQFPLGVFGIALATVIFPVLSRYAVRKDLAGLARTASHALRLTLFIGLPAGLGIILVCKPLILLVFNHGRFAEADDAVGRTAWVASLYALGLWSYSANHILIRAFYAMENIRTPRRVAVLAAGLNLVCNLILVWPLAEGGLALATVLSAVFQTAVLARLLGRQSGHLDWRAVAATTGRTLVGAAVMGAVVYAAIYWAAPLLPLAGRSLYAVQCFGGVAVGAAVFIVAARLMGMSELGDLLTRRTSGADDDGDAPPAAPAA
ncbi:MAG: murein biosynthesis integral membrane protein MurJ [Planctomycetes bacterium]|nr:murein biosynthesis integral membrane protein MurJ [Planctomycetota bacterium]